jgi:hypothetical protein
MARASRRLNANPRPMPGAETAASWTDLWKGGCAMAISGDAVYRWTPQGDWQRLPDPTEDQWKDIGFGPRGPAISPLKKAGV